MYTLYMRENAEGDRYKIDALNLSLMKHLYKLNML